MLSSIVVPTELTESRRAPRERGRVEVPCITYQPALDGIRAFAVAELHAV
jgi:hypothetical protein